MTILDKLIKAKQARLSELKQTTSLAEIRDRAVAVRLQASPRRLSVALSDSSRVNIIAEVKRASPSRGVIRSEVDPTELARAYQAGGAAAISILTEEDYFQGSLDDLRAVRDAVSLPLLRKDFMLDEFQVYESAAAGADAILLIVAALEDNVLIRLRAIGEDELGIDAVVEVHTIAEMKRANACGARIIGVNNRNLMTFEVSQQTSLDLAPHAPPGALLISESGIDSADDIQRLQACGYRAFLVGETLMRADDPKSRLQEFLDPMAGRSTKSH